MKTFERPSTEPRASESKETIRSSVRVEVEKTLASVVHELSYDRTKEECDEIVKKLREAIRSLQDDVSFRVPLRMEDLSDTKFLSGNPKVAKALAEDYLRSYEQGYAKELNGAGKFANDGTAMVRMAETSVRMDFIWDSKGIRIDVSAHPLSEEGKPSRFELAIEDEEGKPRTIVHFEANADRKGRAQAKEPFVLSAKDLGLDPTKTFWRYRLVSAETTSETKN